MTASTETHAANSRRAFFMTAAAVAVAGLGGCVVVPYGHGRYRSAGGGVDRDGDGVPDYGPETALGWWTIFYAGYALSGEVPQRHPTGSGKLIVFQGFETRTGPIVIAAGNDRLFAKLAVALGRADWAQDPRFARNAGRFEHREEILSEVARIVAMRAKGEWIDILEAAGVPCAPVNTLTEMLAEPQTEAVGMLMQVPGLDLRLIGLPIMLDGKRPPIRNRAPRLGEHNSELLGD